MAFTEEQLREAARKAYAAGDTAAAEELFRAAKALPGSKASAVAPPASAPVSLGPQMPMDASGAALGPSTPAFADADPRNAVTPVPAAPVDDSTMIDTIMGGGGYLAQEAARGVTNMLGAPVDLVNQAPRLINLLPGEQGVRSMTDEAARLIDGEYPAQPIDPVGGGQSA